MTPIHFYKSITNTIKNGIENERFFAILDLLFKISLIIVVIPIIALSFFSHPAKEDLWHAINVRDMGFVQTQIYWYLNWSGRFFSSAIGGAYQLIAISFGNYFYWFRLMPALISIGLLFYSIRIFLISTTRNRLFNYQYSWYTFGFLVIYLSGTPAPEVSLYYVPAIIAYPLCNALTFLLLAIALADNSQCPNRYSIFSFLGCILLPIAIVGINEINMIVLLVFSMLGVFITALKKLPNRNLWIIILIATVVSSVISIFSPGNEVRGQYYSNAGLFTDSIVRTFQILPPVIISWFTDLKILGGLIIILSVTINNKIQISLHDRVKIRHIICFLIIWFGFMALPVFVISYAKGIQMSIKPRLLDISYFFFLSGLPVLLIMLSSSIVKISNIFSKKWLIASAKIVMIVGLFASSNFSTAIKDLNKAPAYTAQMENRYKIILEGKDKKLDTIIVPPLKGKPTLFRHIPAIITADHQDSVNEMLADFFQVPSIALKPGTKDR